MTLVMKLVTRDNKANHSWQYDDEGCGDDLVETLGKQSQYSGGVDTEGFPPTPVAMRILKVKNDLFGQGYGYIEYIAGHDLSSLVRGLTILCSDGFRVVCFRLF